MSDAILGAFATHERINHYLLENLSEEAWSAKPPDGKGRTIRAMFAHMHNVRRMWLKAILKGAALPPELDKGTATRDDTGKALNQSYAVLTGVLSEGLAGGKIRGFSPNAATFFAYLVSHESHHRGQITSLARRLGHPLPKQVEIGMWEWGTRSREAKSASA